MDERDLEPEEGLAEYFITHERDYAGNSVVCIATGLSALNAARGTVFGAESIEEARDLAADMVASLKRQGIDAWIDDTTEGASA